jgi:dimethylhistidine N-methyltransferase
MSTLPPASPGAPDTVSGSAPVAASERFTLVGTGREAVREDFAAAVSAGLTVPDKRLSCAWLYDREGSLLFERICTLPEYYPTRCEEEILRTHTAGILEGLAPGTTLVELGSGSAVKTRVLIEALLERRGRLLYAPIDISRSMLEASSRALLADYPRLRVLGVAGDYRDGLHELRRRLEGPRLVLWLGSTVGNLERAEAARFLAEVRHDLDERDRLLLGVDLRKDRGTLERAYDDSQGVTAQFNKNLLARINRDLGGHFDLEAFVHVALYDERLGRVEMHLESLHGQVVRIDALDLEVPFSAGERIHTESSHKYSRHEIEDLAQAAGYALEAQWLDAAECFSLNRLRPLG